MIPYKNQCCIYLLLFIVFMHLLLYVEILYRLSSHEFIELLNFLVLTIVLQMFFVSIMQKDILHF